MLKFVSRELITKGWSDDKKYCARDEAGDKYLLRISKIEQYDRKKNEYERMCQVSSLGVPMCKPIEFGVCEEGFYSVRAGSSGYYATPSQRSAVLVR